MRIEERRREILVNRALNLTKNRSVRSIPRTRDNKFMILDETHWDTEAQRCRCPDTERDGVCAHVLAVEMTRTLFKAENQF